MNFNLWLRAAVCLAVASFPVSSYAADGLAAGVFLGSPMSGVTLKQNQFKIQAGIDKVGVAVDGTWNLGEWLGRMEYAPMYVYAGGQWVDDSTHQWGPRAGLGVTLPVGTGDVELFAEAGTTWYWEEEGDIEFEGAAGARVYF
ncbi:hypothetical protein BZG25_08955 [Salinivibrio sp. ML198]|uniref:hypothetical protein n=1 Tax=Salinivibrio sp. ML198 TaxID=1909458 RepID=UPI000988B235|nr:hypothetical protein [Salinivibrio sp. ML198]OOE79683.1 hypothetical protein BZG25_08955 [Salinivibrio sp. ML198]